MYSNCLIEAIKAKLKDPLNIKLGIIEPRINGGNLHFYWIDNKEKRVYHYKDPNNAKGLKTYFFPGKLSYYDDIDFFYTLLIHKCYKAGLSIKETFAYAKRHHVPLF